MYTFCTLGEINSHLLWNQQKIRMSEVGQVRTVVTQKGIHVPSPWDVCHSALADGSHAKNSGPGWLSLLITQEKLEIWISEVLYVMLVTINILK